VRTKDWNAPRRLTPGTKVFCGSLCDVFDMQAPEEWRTDLFTLIRETPQLVWQLLTKRPEAAVDRVFPRNVWLGATVEDAQSLWRIAALQNETQRGNNPLAVHDSAEAGVREISYWLLKCETLEEFNSVLIHESARSPWDRKEDYTRARDAVLKGDGPGREVVAWATGMKNGTLLQEAIHSLRKSGRTAEILKEVEARVEAELERERIEQAKLEREQAAPAKVEKQRERVAKAERTTATARAAKVKAEAEKPTLGSLDLDLEGISWVIVGGESGPQRREMRIKWLESIASQCRRADVPLFVKQDSGLKPGRQGRIPDELWRLKNFPGQQPG